MERRKTLLKNEKSLPLNTYGSLWEGEEGEPKIFRCVLLVRGRKVKVARSSFSAGEFLQSFLKRRGKDDEEEVGERKKVSRKNLLPFEWRQSADKVLLIQGAQNHAVQSFVNHREKRVTAFICELFSSPSFVFNFSFSIFVGGDEMQSIGG